MRKKAVLGVMALFVLVGGFVLWQFVAPAPNKRPDTLSFAVYNHDAIPIVRRVELNGFVFAEIRASQMSDTGGLPYLGRRNNNLEFSLVWIEMFSKQAWRADFTIPVERLTTFGEEGKHAEIEMHIGAGGDLSVGTLQPEYARLVGLNRNLETTADMVVRVVLAKFCGEMLDDDDPARLVLVAGFEEWSVTGAKKGHENWMHRNSNKLPSSRCTPDWILENE